jgi:nucleoside-diphosphate-sugar epimerase
MRNDHERRKKEGGCLIGGISLPFEERAAQQFLVTVEEDLTPGDRFRLLPDFLSHYQQNKGSKFKDKNMKIAIIGCGYVGTAIARLWSQAGHAVTATTTTPDRIAELGQVAKHAAVVKGDDVAGLRETIRDREVVLLSMGARDRRLEPYRATYLGTAQNVVAIAAQTPSVGQLIYTSSYGILGDRQGEWVDESAPVAPANENGEILAATEQVLLNAHSEQLKVCILRLAGIYGPGRELIRIFRSWAGTTRPGTGAGYTNWIHLEDIVGALELIRLKQLAGIYHLANDTPMPRREFFERLFQRHGLPPIVWDASSPSSDAYNLRLANQKIKAAGLTLIHPGILF